MKKEYKNDNYPKKRNLKNKKTCSIEKSSHSKINNLLYHKFADKLNHPNQNITNINNINIVNMIMSKEKPISIYNIQNRSQSHKKKSYRQKRNNISLLIENKKHNYSVLSKDDIPKYKTNRLLLHSPNFSSKKMKIFKNKKKNESIKTTQKHRSYRNLPNIKLNLFNKLFILE